MALSSSSFKPGQSGNPKGRPPKGYSITDAFRSMFDEIPEKKKEVVDAIFEKAKGGDVTAQKLIWNYMDGIPVQDFTSKGEKLDVFSSEQAARIAKRLISGAASNDNTSGKV